MSPGSRKGAGDVPKGPGWPLGGCWGVLGVSLRSGCHHPQGVSPGMSLPWGVSVPPEGVWGLQVCPQQLQVSPVPVPILVCVPTVCPHSVPKAVPILTLSPAPGVPKLYPLLSLTRVPAVPNSTLSLSHPPGPPRPHCPPQPPLLSCPHDVPAVSPVPSMSPVLLVFPVAHFPQQPLSAHVPSRCPRCPLTGSLSGEPGREPGRPFLVGVLASFRGTWTLFRSSRSWVTHSSRRLLTGDSGGHTMAPPGLAPTAPPPCPHPPPGTRRVTVTPQWPSVSPNRSWGTHQG